MFVYFSKDKIKQYVIDEINKNLLSEIKVDHVDVTIFKTFPYVSLVFNNVVIPEVIQKTQTEDTLISAGTIYLQFNIFDILREKYLLRRVVLEAARCNMKIFSNGNTNYVFWKTDTLRDEKSGFDLMLQKVKFFDVDFQYQNFRNQILISLHSDDFVMSGAFHKRNFDMKFSGDLHSNYLIVGESRMIIDVPLSCSGKMFADLDHDSYLFENTQLVFHGVRLTLDGEYINSDVPSVNFSAQNDKSDLSDIENLLPSHVSNYLESFNKKGVIKIIVKVSGPLSLKQMPSLFADISLENGLLTRPETKVKLENLILKLTYNCEDLLMPENSVIRCQEFSAAIGTGIIEGNFVLKGLTSSFLNINLNAEVELNDIQNLLKFNEIESISGRLICRLNYSGDFADLSQIQASDFLNAQSTGIVSSDRIDLRLSSFLENIYIHSLDGEFSQKNMQINNILVKSCGSDILINGTAFNIFPFLLVEDQQLHIEGNAISNSIFADKIFAANVINEEQATNKNGYIEFPKNVRLDLDLFIKELYYDTFFGRDVKSKLLLNNKLMLLRDMSFKSMDGSVSAEAIIDARPENSIEFRVMANLSNVNITKTFKDLNNFGQTSLTHENLKGKLSGHVHFSSVWSKDLIIDLNSVTVVSDIEVKNGSVSNYEPLSGLRRYFKQRDFSNVEFATLTNQIIIRDREILIPQMIIHSSVMNFEMQGTHNFDNQIEYNFKIQFSELLKKQETHSKRRAEDAYGSIQEENDNKLNWHFKVTGTVDNPKFIPIDMQSMSAKVKQDFRQEGKKAVEILQKEFSSKKDSTEKIIEHQKDEKPRIIIQWDDE